MQPPTQKPLLIPAAYRNRGAAEPAVPLALGPADAAGAVYPAPFRHVERKTKRTPHAKRKSALEGETAERHIAYNGAFRSAFRARLEENERSFFFMSRMTALFSIKNDNFSLILF